METIAENIMTFCEANDGDSFRFYGAGVKSELRDVVWQKNGVSTAFSRECSIRLTDIRENAVIENLSIRKVG